MDILDDPKDRDIRSTYKALLLRHDKLEQQKRMSGSCCAGTAASEILDSIVVQKLVQYTNLKLSL
ncbi:hypothetical protein BG842_07690 [Haladaptatus sp. W1]|nr:hypothetical protein BG842_07690 [Haladaptatus sp. W1]